MKFIFLLLFSALYFLNIQTVNAETTKEMDMSHCIAPSKQDEEFTPYLCPFALPDVRKIEILERIADVKDTDYQADDCSKFLQITENQVLKFLTAANRISNSDLHAKLPEISPCRLSGKIHFKDGTSGDWTLLGGIHLGHIISPHFPESINLYCPESCGFIPSYKFQPNK